MRLNVGRIKVLIANQFLTLSELSKKCGISRQSLSTIIRRGTCTMRNAGKIAAALNVDVAEILKEE